MRLFVEIEYQGERYRPCEVAVEKAAGALNRGVALVSKEQVQLELDRFNGREALHAALAAKPKNWVRPPQEWLLLCLKEIAKTLNGGNRNEPLESEIFTAYVRHYGMSAMWQ